MSNVLICQCAVRRTASRPIWFTPQGDLVCENCLDEAIAGKWQTDSAVVCSQKAIKYAEQLEVEGFVVRRCKEIGKESA